MPAHGFGRGRDRERTWRHVQAKQARVERERAGSEELEDERTFATPPTAGADPGDDPRREDEIEADDWLDDGDPADDAEQAEEPWTRRRLLRSRPAVVLVRLVMDGDDIEPQPTLTPRTDNARRMLGNLCDFLCDRFGPAGRALFTDDEWAALLGHADAPPTHRLVLLTRLAVTGADAFPHEGGTATASDLGLEHYARKFAALPDGTAFAVGLLLAGGKSGQKGDGDAGFDRLPVGVRLLALARALRRERSEGAVWQDREFWALLEAEANALLGTTLPPVPDEQVPRMVTRFRDLLKRHGVAHLFPNAPTRKRALRGGA